MTELIIGMVILAIVGMALTKTLRSQARYFDHQKTADAIVDALRLGVAAGTAKVMCQETGGVRRSDRFT